MAEGMTVHELAAAVGMTPRNIRAHQSRGLLEPPDIRGRVAYYSGSHAARLHLIGSLQREGFTLAAIKRLLEHPGSYSAIVADRRRRFRNGSADMAATVPVSEARVRELFPDAPKDLASSGVAWRDEHGRLVAPTVVVGVGRTLLRLGVPPRVIAALQLEAVRAGREVGDELRGHLTAGDHSELDVARIAVQLGAAVFEMAFISAATEGHQPGDQAGDQSGSQSARR